MVARMIDRLCEVGWFLGALLCVSGAFAQAASDQTIVSEESAALAYEPVYRPEPAPAPPKAPTRSRIQLRSFGAFDVGMPLVLDVDRNLIRPGVNLHMRGGLDIGYVAFFAHGGWRAIPVDFERSAENGHPEYAGEGRDPLQNISFGFGLQGQIPNRTRVLPYLGASFDFNFWHFRESAVACGGYYYWYCANYNVYEFAPGLSGRLGMAVDMARGVYLDLALGMSMSFEGEFFERNEVWLEPFVGVGFRG
jgi:hypothetical protein